MIRLATKNDLSRIAKIFVFNNRMYYYPIFNDVEFSFNYLTVTNVIDLITKENLIDHIYVYVEDDIVYGFIQVDGEEINKLYVDPIFQGKEIVKQLIEFATKNFNSSFLWALEKNVRARKFYNRHGFYENGERKFEENTTEYLVKLVRKE